MIPESDYSNNQAQTSITVLADDVSVANVTLSSGLVQQGFPLTMNVTAANKGDFTETFNVIVYANSTSIGWQTITQASGASTTIILTWITTISDFGNYTVSACATPVANEIERLRCSDDPNGSEHEKSMHLKLYIATKNLNQLLLATSPAQSPFFVLAACLGSWSRKLISMCLPC